MLKGRGWSLVMFMAMFFPLVLPTVALAQATPLPVLGNAVFSRYWARTDYPVADGRAKRGYYFGPEARLVCEEAYREAPGGRRQVVYLDKARLELNRPDSGLVTSGLLAKELIVGRTQLGDDTFGEPYGPATLPVAGDQVESDAPTYASFAGVASTDPSRNRKPRRTGETVVELLNRAGQVSNYDEMARYNVKYADYRDELGHNIANVFVDFFAQRGEVADIDRNGVISYREDRLIDWIQVMGLPLAEPYWANVPVGGNPTWVLIQPFERRVVTFTPTNDPAFQVEMGNIGLAYQAWRHPDGSCTERPVGSAGGGTVDGSVPAPQNAVLRDGINSGPWGTVFYVAISGFRPSEPISFWLTAPDGSVAGTPSPLNIGQHSGTLTDLWATDQRWRPGIWAATYQGDRSNHKAIVYFKVTDRQADAPAGEAVPASVRATVAPAHGWPGTVFRVTITGFQPSEPISFWLTAPDGSVVGTPRPLNIGQHTGNLRDIWPTDDRWASGLWAVTYQGDRSNNQSIVYFRIVR